MFDLKIHVWKWQRCVENQLGILTMEGGEARILKWIYIRYCNDGQWNLKKDSESIRKIAHNVNVIWSVYWRTDWFSVSGGEGHIQSARGFGESRRCRSSSPMRGYWVLMNRVDLGHLGFLPWLVKTDIGSHGIGPIDVLFVVQEQEGMIFSNYNATRAMVS